MEVKRKNIHCMRENNKFFWSGITFFMKGKKRNFYIRQSLEGPIRGKTVK